MRLRNTLIPVAALGLAFTTPSCGSPETTQEARVAGFDHTEEFVFEDLRWEEVRGASSSPYDSGNRVANIRPRIVDGDCHEVYDHYGSTDPQGNYSGEDDSSECYDDFWCSTGEDSRLHCERERKTVWDYSEEVPHLVGICAVQMTPFETKRSEPRSDQDCIDQLTATRPNGERRITRKIGFWIRAAMKDKEGKTQYATMEIPADKWSGLSYGDCIEVKGPKGKPTRQSFVGVCQKK